MNVARESEPLEKQNPWLCISYGNQWAFIVIVITMSRFECPEYLKNNLGLIGMFIAGNGSSASNLTLASQAGGRWR